jgi:plastocyanin
MNPSRLFMPLPSHRIFSAATTLCLILTITGCKHSTPPAESPSTPVPTTTSAPAAAPVDPATASTLTGKVTLTGKPPARLPIDMSMDPACAMAPGTNLTEQYISEKGGLGNVYIYIKSGAPASSAPASTPAVVLDQKGCRYLPHVIALQQGASVEFKNSDPTMHNIHTTPDNNTPSIDISESPMGAPETKPFPTAETMLPVRCNNHPWMQAFINVAPNPWFAITAPDGTFTIPNLPPGTYTLAAVHEKLGEQDIQITVPAKSTPKAAFSFAIK